MHLKKGAQTFPRILRLFCFFVFLEVFLFLVVPVADKNFRNQKNQKNEENKKKRYLWTKSLAQTFLRNFVFFVVFLFLFSSFFWFLVPEAFIGYCFFCFCFPRFFGFWFRKLLSATRTTKNTKTSRKTKKQCLWTKSLAQTFLRILCFFVFFCFCFPRFIGFWFRTLLSAIVFFVFVFLVFLVFGSGSFYRLLGPPKTQKPREKPKKKTIPLNKVLGPDVPENPLFFFVFVFLVFLVFGSGSFYRLLFFLFLFSSFFGFLVPEAFIGY